MPLVMIILNSLCVLLEQQSVRRTERTDFTLLQAACRPCVQKEILLANRSSSFVHVQKEPVFSFFFLSSTMINNRMLCMLDKANKGSKPPH